MTCLQKKRNLVAPIKQQMAPTLRYLHLHNFEHYQTVPKYLRNCWLLGMYSWAESSK